MVFGNDSVDILVVSCLGCGDSVNRNCNLGTASTKTQIYIEALVGVFISMVSILDKVVFLLVSSVNSLSDRV